MQCCIAVRIGSIYGYHLRCRSRRLGCQFLAIQSMQAPVLPTIKHAATNYQQHKLCLLLQLHLIPAGDGRSRSSSESGYSDRPRQGQCHLTRHRSCERTVKAVKMCLRAGEQQPPTVKHVGTAKCIAIHCRQVVKYPIIVRLYHKLRRLPRVLALQDPIARSTRVQLYHPLNRQIHRWWQWW